MYSNFQAAEWNKVLRIKSCCTAHLQICHHVTVPRNPYVRALSNNSQSNLFGHKLSIGITLVITVTPVSTIAKKFQNFARILVKFLHKTQHISYKNSSAMLVYRYSLTFPS